MWFKKKCVTLHTCVFNHYSYRTKHSVNTRVTIKDIAKALNVHHSTVSRALRNDSRVNPETMKMIVDYAEKHGYQVNMSALHLRGSIRNVLAIIVPNINHQFFSNIISHITNLANQNNYVVSIFQTNESVQQEKEIINTIIQNNIAGVIASVSMETTNGRHFMELKKYKIPLVFFDRVCDINVPKVIVNNYEIMTDVVELLVKKGYKKIAHVSGTSKLNVYRERQRGYKDALKQHQLGYERIFIADKSFAVEEGKSAATTLFFDLKNKPDAIICDSYNLLLGIIAKMHEMGLKIPTDVGLIGFGENPSMEVIQPNISAVVQPDKEVATKSFELIMKRLTNDNWDISESIMVSAKIIERESF